METLRDRKVWEWVRVGALDWLAGVAGSGGDLLKVTDAGESGSDTRWHASLRVAGVWHPVGGWSARELAQSFAEAVREAADETADAQVRAERVARLAGAVAA
jgi:hypothetical protein